MPLSKKTRADSIAVLELIAQEAAGLPARSEKAIRIGRYEEGVELILQFGAALTGLKEHVATLLAKDETLPPEFQRALDRFDRYIHACCDVGGHFQYPRFLNVFGNPESAIADVEKLTTLLKNAS